MDRLNADMLKAPERPVRVLQFGEGNFLRAFVDYMIDIANEKADFNGIARKYGVSTVIARIMRNREVRTDEEINLYLNGTPEDLYDGRLM